MGTYSTGTEDYRKTDAVMNPLNIRTARELRNVCAARDVPTGIFTDQVLTDADTAELLLDHGIKTDAQTVEVFRKRYI